MQCLKLVLFGALFGVISSCSVITRIGVQTAAPSLKKASVSAQYEHDWDHFKDSILSQLKLLELLLEIEPDNSNLLESLVKGYAGLGFGYYETVYLKDYYQDRDQSEFKVKAIDAYSRALSYANQYLKNRGSSLDLLTKKMNNQKDFFSYMDSKFGKSDTVTLFYMTQALASMINLNRDSVSLMSKINLATNALEWVCKKDPNVEYGMCYLFKAGLMATRPRMLGGNPKKAASDLKKYMKEVPGNALTQIFYLQYIVIPSDDKKEFEKVSYNLKKFFKAFEDRFVFPGENKKDPLNLFNAIAKKRWVIMNQMKKDIF